MIILRWIILHWLPERRSLFVHRDEPARQRAFVTKRGSLVH
jgi:hypothetical protein